MKTFLAGAVLCAFSTAAFAAPTVSPNYTTTASVLYNPLAPTSNFGAPTNMNNESAYTVRTGIDSNYFYVDVTASPPPGVAVDQFANLYLGGPSSSQGFIIETTNDRAIKTGDTNPADYVSLAGSGFSYTANPNDISFALPISFLETDPLGIGFTKYNPGDIVRVSGSQSFGYSYAGGPVFYDSVSRLGAQTVPAAASGAVPEPATWAMMILGMGAIGFAMRRRVRASEVKFNTKIKRLSEGAVA